MSNHVLSGQTVIITGASQGIGQAVAKQLAPLGANLVLCARSLDKMETLAAQLKTLAPDTTVICLRCDVRDPRQAQTVADETVKRFGRVDVLINNAGVAPKVGLLQEMGIEDIDRTIDTNLKGAIYFMKAVLPAMIHQQAGTIINVNSIAGKTAYPYWGIYDASKFGLHAVTEAVADEQRCNNIRVMGIYPGAVNTAIWDGLELNHEPNHEGMLRAASVAEAILYVLQQPQNVFIQDITLAPLRPVL